MMKLTHLLSSGWVVAILIRLVFLIMFHSKLLPKFIWDPIMVGDRIVWTVTFLPFITLFSNIVSSFSVNVLLLFIAAVTLLILIVAMRKLKFKGKSYRFVGEVIACYIITAPLCFVLEFMIGLNIDYEYFSD